MARSAGFSDDSAARLVVTVGEKSIRRFDETYGYRRVHAQLLRWGQHCTPELVRSIMRELGLMPASHDRRGAA
jgi:hypothetical protein